MPGCEIADLRQFIRAPLHPERCGKPSVTRVLLTACASLDCGPRDCRGHDVCADHLVGLLEAPGLVKDQLTL